MRLTAAGWALLLFLLIACPLAGYAGYRQLTGEPITLPTFGGPAPTPAAATPARAPATPTAPPRPQPSATAAPSSTAAPAGTPTAAPRPQPSPTVPPAARPVVTVAYDAFPPYYPVRIAAVLGYAGARGIELRQVPFGLNGQNVFSETERLAKLRSGEWDVLLTTLDTYALLADPEVGKIVALVDESAGADKILVRAPIRTINDLRGKRVSYSEGSVSEFFLYSSLALAGLTANDVQRRPAETITEALQLYRAGAVDAVVGWEPDILDLEGLPDTRVLLTTERYRAILDAMIVSTRAIREKPDAVQKWVEAWFAAVKLSIDDPRQAGEAIVRSGNSDWTGIARPEDYPAALKTTAQATLAQNQLAFNDPAALAARFKEAQAVWQSAGRTVRPVDPNALIEPRFVLQAANDPTLLSTRPPVNDTFALTSRIQAPRLSAEEIGRAEPVAVLPLQFIQFDPDSAVIRPESRRDIAEQVVPVLKRTPGVYLKVEGSAAKPLGVSDEEVEQTARDRTAAVVSFIVGQGIDPNRIISGTLKPQFPNSTREEELRQDRKVVFTLIVPQGR